MVKNTGFQGHLVAQLVKYQVLDLDTGLMVCGFKPVLGSVLTVQKTKRTPITTQKNTGFQIRLVFKSLFAQSSFVTLGNPFNSLS